VKVVYTIVIGKELTPTKNDNGFKGGFKMKM